MKNQLKIILIIFLQQHVIITNSTNPANPDNSANSANPENPNPKPKQKIEFLENISNQTYLDSIELEDRYYLDLLSFDEQLHKIEKKHDGGQEGEEEIIKLQVPKSCPNEILHDLGVKGFRDPLLKGPEVLFCNKMKYNCCSVTDFGEIEEILNKYKISIQLNHNYFQYYVVEIFKHFQDYELAADQILEKPIHPTCERAAEVIKNTHIDHDIISNIEKMIKKISKFDWELKSGFRCLLCDYDNAKFIDTDFKYVKYHVNVCKKIADKTFKYYYYFNSFVFKYINTVNFVAHCRNKQNSGLSGNFNFNDDGNKFDFFNIDNSFYLEQCRYAYDQEFLDKDIIKNCMNYCHKYNFFGFSKSLFKDTKKFERIFNNVKENLFLSFDTEVDAPNEEELTFHFPFKTSEFDIFTFYDSLFTTEGIDPDNFIEDI